MQLPKLQKTNISLNLALTIVTFLILAAEAYYAWAYLYNNLINSQIAVTDSENIVRLNSKTYTTTVEMLDKRLNFTPSNTIPFNPNPFR